MRWLLVEVIWWNKVDLSKDRVELEEVMQPLRGLYCDFSVRVCLSLEEEKESKKKKGAHMC